MILQKIVLGNDEESKRRAIQENLGQQVILGDEQQELGHAELLTDPAPDRETYWVRFGDGRGDIRLHYHDLQQLCKIVNHSAFQRPKLEPHNEELPQLLSKNNIALATLALLAGFVAGYTPQIIKYFSK